jgi:hypothetical protein
MLNTDVIAAIGIGLIAVLSVLFVVVRIKLKRFSAGSNESPFLHLIPWMKSSNNSARLAGTLFLLASSGVTFTTVILAISAIEHREPSIMLTNGLFTFMMVVTLTSCMFLAGGANALEWINVTSKTANWRHWTVVIAVLTLSVGAEFLYLEFLASWGYTETGTLY